MSRLEGKVAIVTGGASGIGAATVRLFSEHGAKVVIADIQDELGHALARNINAANVCYIHCDVSDEDQVRNLVDETVSKFGQLDVMYSNAGVFDDDFHSILDARREQLDRILNVNLVGGFLAAKHAARVMVEKHTKPKGCIMCWDRCTHYRVRRAVLYVNETTDYTSDHRDPLLEHEDLFLDSSIPDRSDTPNA